MQKRLNDLLKFTNFKGLEIPIISNTGSYLRPYEINISFINKKATSLNKHQIISIASEAEKLYFTDIPFYNIVNKTKEIIANVFNEDKRNPISYGLCVDIRDDISVGIMISQKLKLPLYITNAYSKLPESENETVLVLQNDKISNINEDLLGYNIVHITNYLNSGHSIFADSNESSQLNCNRKIGPLPTLLRKNVSNINVFSLLNDDSNNISENLGTLISSMYDADIDFFKSVSNEYTQMLSYKKNPIAWTQNYIDKNLPFSFNKNPLANKKFYLAYINTPTEAINDDKENENDGMKILREYAK